MKTVRLASVAKVIRSKNAGVDKITFDIIFPDRGTYERIVRGGGLSRARIAALYGIPETRISDFVAFDPACAVKFTVYRSRPSGSPGDPDIFGAQQYGPLMDLEVPVVQAGEEGGA